MLADRNVVESEERRPADELALIPTRPFARAFTHVILSLGTAWLAVCTRLVTRTASTLRQKSTTSHSLWCLPCATLVCSHTGTALSAAGTERAGGRSILCDDTHRLSDSRAPSRNRRAGSFQSATQCSAVPRCILPLLSCAPPVRRHGDAHVGLDDR
jgi:hypothetical protein